VGKLLSAIIGLGLFVVMVQRYSMRGDSARVSFFQYVPQDDDEEDIDLPLQEFESLQYALRNSQLVGLYFAASWCPHSTPVTALLDEHFRDIILPPPEGENPKNLPQRHGFSIVYVSSDRDAKEMKGYIQPNWMAVPFESEDRTALKGHFKTCAKRELNELGFERKHEIPTLIILSGATHEVLTFHGVKDVKEYGSQAIDHWMELDSLSSALGSKFA